MIVLIMKKIVSTAVLLAMCISLIARQKPAYQQSPVTQEQLLHKLYAAQASGNDSAFYKVQHTLMDYSKQRQDWSIYYRTWMNRVIYEVNHKRFHRAYIEIRHLTDDVKARHQEQYLYMANMGLGFFYNGRNQPEMGEKFFWRASRASMQKKTLSPCSTHTSHWRRCSVLSNLLRLWHVLTVCLSKCSRTRCTRVAYWDIGALLPIR